jgi:hypothetical protein
MISTLPEPYREVLVLTEFEGLTQKEMAERRGILLSGAKSRVQRGREQLKQMLLERCDGRWQMAKGAKTGRKWYCNAARLVLLCDHENVDNESARGTARLAGE